MTGRQLTQRWLVAGLAVYALVLHALAMGVASVPRAQDSLFAVHQLCSGGTGPHSAPVGHHPGDDPVSCALCAVGHAALDVPPVLSWPLPAAKPEAVAAAFAPHSSAPKPQTPAEARPRAPPAFV